MPLPPYIHEKLKDQNRYQTVYAKDYGSAAAPTAGLHFTKEILQKIHDYALEEIMGERFGRYAKEIITDSVAEYEEKNKK